MSDNNNNSMISSSSSFCTTTGMVHSTMVKSSERNALPVMIIPGDAESGETHVHPNADNNSMSSDNMDHRGHDDHGMPPPTRTTTMPQGTIMFMDGFHSTLFPSSRGGGAQSSAPPPCLNLFYPSWTLHTPSRFVFAMIAITFMGILVEACGVWRVKILRRGREVRWKRVQRLREEQRRRRSQHHHPRCLEDAAQDRQMEFCKHQSPQLGLQRGGGGAGDASSGEASLLQSTSMAAPSSSSAPPPPPPISFRLPSAIRRMGLAIAPKCVRVTFAKICCCFDDTRINKNDGMRAARWYDLIAACLHALRAWLGYLLMLAVMTYAVEFLVSAVVGMVLGRYYCCVERMEEGGIVDSVGAVTEDDDAAWGGGGDPCCGVDDDIEDDYHYHDNHNGVVGPTSSLTDSGICEPLLSSSSSDSNARVTRRLVG